MVKALLAFLGALGIALLLTAFVIGLCLAEGVIRDLLGRPPGRC